MKSKQTLLAFDNSAEYARTRKAIGLFFLITSFFFLGYMVYIIVDGRASTMTYAFTALIGTIFAVELYMLAKFGLEGVYRIG